MPWDQVIPVIVALIGGGLVIGLLDLRPRQRSMDAQATESMVSALNTAITSMRDEVSVVRDRNKSLTDLVEVQTSLTRDWENKYNLLNDCYAQLAAKHERLEMEFLTFHEDMRHRVPVSGQPLERRRRPRIDLLIDEKQVDLG